MNLKGEKVLLRAIEKEDLTFLKEMINDSEIEQNVVGWSLPVSEDIQLRWYEKQMNECNIIRYAIEYNKNFVGTIIIDNIDWKNSSVVINIKLIKEHRNEGLGTDALNIGLKYIFEELNMNRVVADILDYNIASQKLFIKSGFKLEGKQRQAIFKNNKYNDLLIYSILRKEYKI